MIVYFQRLALISSLLVLVLAVLWSHIANRIVPFVAQLLGGLVPSFKSHISSRENSVRLNTGHPKLNGHRLIKSTKFSNLNLGHQTRGLSETSPSNVSIVSGLSQGLLMVIIVGVAILMFYSVISILNKQISGTKYNRARLKRKSNNKSTKSRADRARFATELIKQHGGKNISDVIRFLASELDKQRLQSLEKDWHLYKNQEKDDNCSDYETQNKMAHDVDLGFETS